VAARFSAYFLLTSINLTLRGIIASGEFFNAGGCERTKLLLFYCGTMPASLLQDQML